MIFKCIMVVLTLLSYARGGPVDFKSCPGVVETGHLYNVLVSNCTSFPCVFVRGMPYSIEMDFENSRGTPTLKASVIANIGGIWLDWPGMETDGCKNMLVGWCPLEAGDYVTYGMAMRVEPIYPQVETVIRWSLSGNDEQPIFCFEIPVKLI